MLNNLPFELQDLITSHLSIQKKQLLNTTIKLSPISSTIISNTIKINAKRILLVFRLRSEIKHLFAMLRQHIPSYNYSLCNKNFHYLPYNNQCLFFSPIRQQNPICRFCKEYKANHKYWKMMKIFFQINHIF
jgi:hypothetical protein